MEKITFCPENGEAVEFFVLEQTRLGGVDYSLVTDSEDDDAEALILKDVSAPEDEEAIYSIVDDDKEMDRQCGRVYDAMVRLDKFDPKLSQIYGLSEFDHLTLRVTEQIVLAQLVFDQSHRQSGRIDRNIQLPQHIRKCSDMILMTVRNHKALYPIRIFL